jgi:hypothetical protein
MDCPICGNKLNSTKAGGIIYYDCSYCHYHLEIPYVETLWL